jgi:hypothetical protein
MINNIRNIIENYNLYFLTVLGICIMLYTVINWNNLNILQRCVGLFDMFIILHLGEEGKYPGGFTEMITDKLNFTQINPKFGELITSILVLIIGFIPFFFSNIPFLVFACIVLGYVEAIAHIVAIRMFDKEKPYTPGMFTAVFLLLPVSLYTTYYLVINNLMNPISYLFALIYLLIAVAIAQQIVVRTSGMKYSEFISNAKKALLK